MRSEHPQRIWHPFTQAKTAPMPLKVKRGYGTRLELEDGRVILDMISSWWVNLHGHANAEIAAAIYEQSLQLEQVIFAGFTHEPAEEFARELLDVLNSLGEANAVAPGGSSANATTVGPGPADPTQQTGLAGATTMEAENQRHTAKSQFLSPSHSKVPDNVNEVTALKQLISGASASAGSPEPIDPDRNLINAPSGSGMLNHVFYSDNGSTAVEVALKMAFQFWQNLGRSEKTGFLCFDGGYHGDTIGAMSIGGASPFWQGFQPLMFPVHVLPYASTYEADGQAQQTEDSALAAMRTILEREAPRLAAIIIEPLIQGVAGMKICRPGFLANIQSLAREFDVLLIFDEVMTGFGRTGDWFACKKTGVIPDIVCLSKGITGGFLPLSATVCSARVYDAFFSDDWRKMLPHGHSYTANPLALAAARASLRLLKKNRASFAGMEERHRNFSRILLEFKQLKRHRYCGTMFAVDIETADGGYYDQVGPQLRELFLTKGLLIRPLGNTIYLLPPYCTTDDELQTAYQAIAEAVSALSRPLTLAT